MRRILLVVASLSLCLPVATAVARSVGAKDVATSAGICSFIASGGTIRGAYLEAALQQIRREHPGLQASDQELAAAILAQPRDSAAR